MTRMTKHLTVADLLALPPETVVLVRVNLDYRPAQVVRIASTEYGLEPVGAKKVAICPA